MGNLVKYAPFSFVYLDDEMHACMHLPTEFKLGSSLIMI
jgi:hypothetical protein